MSIYRTIIKIDFLLISESPQILKNSYHKEDIKIITFRITNLRRNILKIVRETKRETERFRGEIHVTDTGVKIRSVTHFSYAVMDATVT